MDKTTHLIIIAIAIILGGLFAWTKDYHEWWQWILSIIVTGIIVYIIVGIFMAIVTIVAIISLYKYWQNNKKTIKFKLCVIWEKMWRPYSSIEEVEDYVRSTYNLE